jgi:hypothetical protein
MGVRCGELCWWRFFWQESACPLRLPKCRRPEPSLRISVCLPWKGRKPAIFPTEASTSV